MMTGETAALHDAPERVRRLLGRTRIARYTLLPRQVPPGVVRSGAAGDDGRRGTAVAGLTHAAELSQVRLLADEQVAQKDCSRTGGSIRTSAGGPARPQFVAAAAAEVPSVE